MPWFRNLEISFAGTIIGLVIGGILPIITIYLFFYLGELPIFRHHSKEAGNPYLLTIAIICIVVLIALILFTFCIIFMVKKNPFFFGLFCGMLIASSIVGMLISTCFGIFTLFFEVIGMSH